MQPVRPVRLTKEQIMNLRIYYVEQNPAHTAVVDPIFDRLDAGALQAVTSPITLAECLVGTRWQERCSTA